MSNRYAKSSENEEKILVPGLPPYQQKQVRLQLSTILKAVISQRRVPRADGKGRVPALEVLISTALTRELIAGKDPTKELPAAISKGFTTCGMQTFDQSLMSLVKQDLVTYDEALDHVSNPEDFALRFRGIASTSDSSRVDPVAPPPACHDSGATVWSGPHNARPNSVEGVLDA